MATSGTYNFAPSLGELVLYAFNLAGVRNTAIVQEHMFSARMAANLLLASWSNDSPTLWTVDLVTVPFEQSPAVITASVASGIATLTFATPNTPVYTVDSEITVAGVNTSDYNGVFTVVSSGPGSVSYACSAVTSGTGGTISTATPAATYSVDPSTIMILDTYLGIIPSSGPEIDRVILPISRSEYATYPNKSQTGFSTVYWYDRLISPTITLWPVPDGSSAQVLKYYRVRQVQDANYTGGQNVDIPYRFLDAFADGMACRLAKIWNPDKYALLKGDADKSYGLARAQDVEGCSYYVSPMISGYYR